MLVYVAGPYRDICDYKVLCNIRRAQEVAEELWKNGYYALCPHVNTAFLSGICPEENFLKGGLKMLAGCEAVVLVEGWKESVGTNVEIVEAFKLNIPVYACIENLQTGMCLTNAEYKKLKHCE